MSRFELPAGFTDPALVVAVSARPTGRQRTFRRERRTRIAQKQAFLRSAR